MIDRYTVKAVPAAPFRSPQKLDEMKENDPEQLKKLQHFNVKVEVVCEPRDLKKITDFLKELAKK